MTIARILHGCKSEFVLRKYYYYYILQHISEIYAKAQGSSIFFKDIIYFWNSNFGVMFWNEKLSLECKQILTKDNIN